jgi:hypothetical protein
MRLLDECKKPPTGMLWQVRRSIGWIFPADLEGISSLKLIDELAPARETSAAWYKKAQKNDYFVLGWYKAKAPTEAAITLNIGDIYKCIPVIYRWTPVATLIITQTLAHEVGHHMSYKKGYAVALTGRLEKKPDRDEEARAESYALAVMTRMRRRWHYRLAALAVNDLTQWYDVQALLDWRAGKYKDAARKWYKAAVLDPYDRRLASCYWRAKEMCDSNPPALTNGT